MAFWEQAPRERWVKHYASSHRILLVGEGDFSFALSLAIAFGSGSNIVATSFDSYEGVISKYRRGYSNLRGLERFGAKLIFQVDATKMKYSASYELANWRFDRIVYNFPHAGFHGRENDHLLIRMHQDLVEGFFRNAAEMLQPYGEVHVSHKTSPPYCYWEIEELAFRNSLELLERVNFNINDYRGYENKRGDGFKADDSFILGACCTYKFVLSPGVNEICHDMIRLNYSYTEPRSAVCNPAFIRFNVCGISMGEPGFAGCGGVLMDDDGNFLFMFSTPLGNLKSDVAELCALEVALCKFLSSRFCGKRPVLMRSNSDVVVSWVNNPIIRPMHLMRHFVEIDAMLRLAYDVRVRFIRRKDNLSAESLAKNAIHGQVLEANL